MAIKNLSDVLKKLNKRKRQPEGTIDLFDNFENPRKKKKCVVRVEEEITKKKHKSSDIKSYTTEETIKSIVCHENEKRKSAQEKSHLNKIEDPNTAIHSSKPQKEKKHKTSGIHDKNINNVAEKIKSKRRKKKDSTRQANLQKHNDKKTVATSSEEVPSVQIKTEVIDESLNCDIMLNVTSEPVKPKKENKNFFNDVHSNIEKMNRRNKKAYVSEPGEYLVLGDLKSQIEDHEPHEDGVKLSFKKSDMSKYVLPYHKGSTLAYAKKAYKNYVKGDLIVHFKNSNLHEIPGYGRKGK